MKAVRLCITCGRLVAVHQIDIGEAVCLVEPSATCSDHGGAIEEDTSRIKTVTIHPSTGGYQPITSLDPNNPPRGGSGVPRKGD